MRIITLRIFQIQNLTHISDLSILKRTMKLEDDKQKVYALIFPNKLVSFYLNYIFKYIFIFYNVNAVLHCRNT